MAGSRSLLRALLWPLLLLLVLPGGRFLGISRPPAFLLASAKTTLGRAQLTGELTESFLSKFAFSLGRGRVTATFYLTEPYLEMSKALNLYVFCDEEWAQWKQLYTCVDRVKLARQTRALELRDSGPEFERAKAMVRRNGGPADSITQAAVITTTIDHYIRTHYWYAFVADCSLEMYNHKVPPLHFNVTFLNGGSVRAGASTDNATSEDTVREPGDHMPADERGMFALHMFNLVLLGAACAVNVLLAWRRMGDSRTVHLVVLLLLAAMSASAQSSFFELLHLMRYAQNGMGFPALDLASALSEAFSDWIVSFILLAISCGWTLGGSGGMGSGLGMMHLGGGGGGGGVMGGGGGMLQSIRSALKSPASLVTRPSLASVVLVAMFVVHLVLVIWSAVGFEDDFDKFHDHEHTPGMILMWSRVGLSALFAVLCSRTMGRDGVGDMAQFLRLFRTAGVVWFGIMPLLVVVAKLFAQYLRHPVITGGEFRGHGRDGWARQGRRQLTHKTGTRTKRTRTEHTHTHARTHARTKHTHKTHTGRLTSKHCNVQCLVKHWPRGNFRTLGINGRLRVYYCTSCAATRPPGKATGQRMHTRHYTHACTPLFAANWFFWLQIFFSLVIFFPPVSTPPAFLLLVHFCFFFFSVKIGTLTVQSCTLCIFSWLFLGSKRTLYYRKSTVGAASGGLGLSAGLDSGTKTTFKLPGTSMRTHCD
jgi:hypothetical protein